VHAALALSNGVILALTVPPDWYTIEALQPRSKTARAA
jgi:hypothetical protein